MARLLFLDGTAAFSPTRLSTKAAGGIVTSLTTIPKFLASRGHEVYVVSVHEGELFLDGVWYTRDREKMANPDVVIFNRNTITNSLVDCFPNARIVWWLHDICDPRYMEDNSYERADCVVALSRYNMETYADYYSIPEDKFIVIPNGVDKSVFYESKKERNPNLFIVATAPIKGLEPVDYFYMNMLRHNPDLELRLYCSQSLHDLEDDERTKRLLAGLAAKGAKVLDPIPQKELADVMRQAYAMLMPSSYPENCSNLLLQARACGLPVIATNIGANPEFIEHNVTGLLTKTIPSDKFYWWYDFTRLAVRLWLNRPAHSYISKHAPENIASWDEIGARWNELLTDVIEVAA